MYQSSIEIETSYEELSERFGRVLLNKTDKEATAYAESELKARYAPKEDRLEYYEIRHPEIKKNAAGVCIICLKSVCIMTVY
jgi:hypothetical protein